MARRAVNGSSRRSFPDGYWHERYTDARPVVFGHHVVGREPMIRDGRTYGLDTGACHGWNLTALCLPARTIHSVRAHDDHWSAAKRRWQLPVLKSRPWQDSTWPDIARTVERLFPVSDPATRRWLEALQAWAADLQAAFPTLVAAAHRTADALPPDEMRQHPAARVLFQARSGRLDVARLAGQCPTPRRTIAVAAVLGQALEEKPTAPR